jgi:hypothetical protein
MSYTNYNNIPLVLSVWLAANDGYDLKQSDNVVSATSLMKPTKSLILGNRVHASETEEQVVDVSDLVPSRLGTAVHTAAEVAWLYSRESALTALGYPQQVIDKIRLNPDEPGEDPQFDIYLEQRSSKAIGKWVISGKFDFVENGRVKDIKTTKTYNWIKGSNDEKYRIQGSIYRWLNPEIITDDYVDILMVFTDWSPLKAKVDKDYPKANIQVRTLPLMSLEETERWIKNRLTEIERYWDAHQDTMPACTPEELWMDPPKYAYYKSPKAQRATKLYNTPQEANAHKARDGIPGSKVVERKSEPKFCKYCEGRQICLQAQNYIAEGLLKL